MTPTRAKAIAQMAYVFTVPLVMNYRAMYRRAVDASSSSFSGGFGTWRQVAPTESGSGGVVGPSRSALQSTVWLDLRTEPWWYTEPAVPPGVSFGSRWMDLWGFELDDRGAPEGGRHRASVLAASPTRVRDVPGEIDGVVRGESAFVALRTEVRWCGESAGRDVPRVLADIVLEPVSAHLGRPAPAPAPAMSWWRWRSGQPWDASLSPDDIAEAIGAGIDGALSDLLEAASETIDAYEKSWRREEMDRNYFGRALRALCPVDPFGGLGWPTVSTEASQ